ncbi:MAG: Alkylglycerone-phosphate synthase [Solirubrobacterales bacterium]|nr:Alkylglycerone-phosphate synthase [Solirubrobacterales bacterium]
MSSTTETRRATADPLAPRLRWFGWGGPQTVDAELPEAATALLSELGATDRHTPPVDLDDVVLPDPAFDGAGPAEIVGAEFVRTDRATRIAHAAGRSYLDLLRLRAGDAADAPDVVVYPADEAEVAALLRACARSNTVVVPFGGGTSVVGGVSPVRDGRDLVVIDLRRLDRLVCVDVESQTATVQAGMLGPALEAALEEHGLTLGHHPQSFEYSTVGGWVATRSAGQASTGYGRIDELVLGLRCVTPAGELVGRTLPATAAGPDLRQLLIGSEGALGIITEVTLRVRPRPAVRHVEAWRFPSFAAGLQALRALEQGGVAPDVARLSDEEEGRLNRLVAAHTAAVEDGVAAIFAWEGEAATVAARREASAAVARAHGGSVEEGDGGPMWLAGRYAAPYVRDVLLNRGLLVETLETAVAWSGIEALHAAVGHALRDALAEPGVHPLVLCHVSHLYPTGASLYFTVLAPQRAGDEAGQWKAAKRAAMEAILAGGATITHHHAIGRDHVPWLEREAGVLGVETLRASKARLDPSGIMNPGVLGL